MPMNRGISNRILFKRYPSIDYWVSLYLIPEFRTPHLAIGEFELAHYPVLPLFGKFEISPEVTVHGWQILCLLALVRSLDLHRHLSCCDRLACFHVIERYGEMMGLLDPLRHLHSHAFHGVLHRLDIESRLDAVNNLLMGGFSRRIVAVVHPVTCMIAFSCNQRNCRSQTGYCRQNQYQFFHCRFSLCLYRSRQWHGCHEYLHHLSDIFLESVPLKA